MRDSTSRHRTAQRPARSDARRGDRVTQVYCRLREAIVWGRLAPGARIVESEIADRYGVSRTPVSAAIRRLEQEGFIIAIGHGRQSRFAVAPLTEEDARELFSIVAELEGLAAGRTARLPAPDRETVTRELARRNEELQRAAATNPADHNRIFDADQAFHRHYVDAAAGRRITRLHDGVKPQTDRYIRLYISALVDEIGVSVEEHEAIITAIASGDPEAAHAAVRVNWHNAADRLCRVIRALGEHGTW